MYSCFRETVVIDTDPVTCTSDIFKSLAKCNKEDMSEDNRLFILMNHWILSSAGGAQHW